ncbi:MAG: ROK family protein [Chitinophagaceae bacterium]
MSSWVTGVDIGGSHITVCSIDMQSGNIDDKSLVRWSVDSSAEAASIIECWADAIQTSHEKSGRQPTRLGIAMPGPFDYELGISYIRGLSKYEALYGMAVKDLLAKKLKIDSSQIRMINDASAYVLGECSFGCARNDQNVLGITLGTGLGSARMIKGVLQDGDLYQFPFANGVAEDILSTRWFIAEYHRRSGQPIEGVRELALLANEDKLALQLFQEFGNNLGDVINDRYKSEMPATLVLGGNIALAWYLFLSPLKKSLGEHIEVKLATLGEAAALIGAASRWK